MGKWEVESTMEGKDGMEGGVASLYMALSVLGLLRMKKGGAMYV
jgi:hypothetical protein